MSDEKTASEKPVDQNTKMQGRINAAVALSMAKTPAARDIILAMIDGNGCLSNDAFAGVQQKVRLATGDFDDDGLSESEEQRMARNEARGRMRFHGHKLKTSMGQVLKDEQEEMKEKKERDSGESRMTLSEGVAKKEERNERLVSALFDAYNAKTDGKDLQLDGNSKNKKLSENEKENAQKAVDALNIKGVDVTDGLSRDEKAILRDQLKGISASLKDSGVTTGGDLDAVASQNYRNTNRTNERQFTR